MTRDERASLPNSSPRTPEPCTSDKVCQYVKYRWPVSQRTQYKTEQPTFILENAADNESGSIQAGVNSVAVKMGYQPLLFVQMPNISQGSNSGTFNDHFIFITNVQPILTVMLRAYIQ